MQASRTRKGRGSGSSWRASIAAWVGITLFLVLLFVLPSPYRWLIWIPYGVALPLVIVSLNRKQQAIRSDEQRTRQA